MKFRIDGVSGGAPDDAGTEHYEDEKRAFTYRTIVLETLGDLLALQARVGAPLIVDKPEPWDATGLYSLTIYNDYIE